MEVKFVTIVCFLMFVGSLQAQDNKIEWEQQLQEVVVTGTGTKHLLKNAPVQTEVLSGKLLRNYAGKSIEEILSGLTSSFAFNEDDMGSQMQMNGLGNSYILILIDGKRIHGDVGGQNDLGMIDPANIEKIEIVKGASSALYGSDAIAGVINIITRKHLEGFLAENTTRVGSYGDVRQHNGIGFQSGKWSSWTNFQLQHSDGWQNTSVEDVKQTEFLITDSKNKTVNRHTNWQISEKLTYRPIEPLELYVDGSLYWKRIYRPSGKYASTDVNTYDLQYNNSSLSIGAKWTLNSTDFITLDADWNRHAYYYNFTDTTLMDGYIDGKFTPYFPYFPGQKNLQSDQQRTMVNLKGVFVLPYMNRLSMGVEWRYDWLKAPMRVTNGKASDNTEAFYVQDEFGLLAPLQLTVGMRINRNEQFGFRFTPKVSAMLSLGDFRIRGTWSQGFKTPTPKELHYRYVKEMAGTRLFLGNTNLKPQNSDYFSLSGEYNYNGITVSLTGYYNQVGNKIALVTIPTSQAPAELIIKYDPVKVRQYQNLEKVKTYGIDVNVRYTMQNLAIGLGYSYLNTDANIYDTSHDRMKNVTIDGMAHHKGNVFVTWSKRFSDTYRFNMGIYGRMSSKRYYQDFGNGKGFQIWRISTTHDLGRSTTMSYRLEAGMDNIFNYIDKTPHGLHLGTTTPGTTLFVSLAIRFSKGKKVKPINYNNNQFNDNEEN